LILLCLGRIISGSGRHRQCAGSGNIDAGCLTGLSSSSKDPLHSALPREAPSDGALMDITPAVAAVLFQRDGDGMVGFLIVGLGVLVGGVVGAGHPAAGQAAPQLYPAASAIKALQTLGRVWLDRAGGGDVVARGEVVEAAARTVWSWHRRARLGWDVASSSELPSSRAGNEQVQFSPSCGVINDAEQIIMNGTSRHYGIWLGDWLELR
jgi:hypothetical protein